MKQVRDGVLCERIFVEYATSDQYGTSKPLNVYLDPEEAADSVLKPQSDCEWDPANPSREQAIAMLKSDYPKLVIVEHCKRRGVVKGIIRGFSVISE